MGMLDHLRDRLAAAAAVHGITVVWHPVQGNPYPTVQWPAEDLTGFLVTAGTMNTTAIYAGTHVLTEELLGDIEERLVEAEHSYGPDSEISPEAQQLVDEAARHLAETIALSAMFIADNIMHTWSVSSEWYADYATRMGTYASKRDHAWLTDHRARAKRATGQTADLKVRLLADEWFLQLPNDTGRRTYVRELSIGLYGEDDGGRYETWWPALDQAWHERNSRIAPERTARFRTDISEYATQLGERESFAAATTKAARRSVAKAFLQETDPLLVSTDNIELLLIAVADYLRTIRAK